MVYKRQFGFDGDDRKVIKFLQECGWPEPVAQTYLAYIGQLYPHPPPEDLKAYGIETLQRSLDKHYSTETLEAFIQLLASHGFMDNLTPEHIESVIRDYIRRQKPEKLPDPKKDELIRKLDEIMPILHNKLEAYGENRRQHYLREPAKWAISKEGKESFLKALLEADVAIKLPAYSGETFFESWGIGPLFIDKLKQGVNIKILFMHPELGSHLEGRPPAKKTVEMVDKFLKQVEVEKREFEQAGKTGFGDIQFRWIRQPRFAHFTGLLTYVSPLSTGSAVARLNIHRVGLERGTVGLIITSDNDIGATSLFRTLETYFDEAWKRAEPLSGFRLWWSRILDFALSYRGVILIVLMISMLFFVNSFVATVLFFVYPIILALGWRRYDESARVL